jgi:YgiT-type zinc finger domain-containing protein
MECEFCGGETTKKYVKRQHWLKGRLYIVENVSAEVCMDCGERYFHVRTLDALDEYLSKQHKVKAKLDVELVQFEPAIA